MAYCWEFEWGLTFGRCGLLSQGAVCWLGCALLVLLMLEELCRWLVVRHCSRYNKLDYTFTIDEGQCLFLNPLLNLFVHLIVLCLRKWLLLILHTELLHHQILTFGLIWWCSYDQCERIYSHLWQLLLVFHLDKEAQLFNQSYICGEWASVDVVLEMRLGGWWFPRVWQTLHKDTSNEESEHTFSDMPVRMLQALYDLYREYVWSCALNHLSATL